MPCFLLRAVCLWPRLSSRFTLPDKNHLSPVLQLRKLITTYSLPPFLSGEFHLRHELSSHSLSRLPYRMVCFQKKFDGGLFYPDGSEASERGAVEGSCGFWAKGLPRSPRARKSAGSQIRPWPWVAQLTRTQEAARSTGKISHFPEVSEQTQRARVPTDVISANPATACKPASHTAPAHGPWPSPDPGRLEPQGYCQAWDLWPFGRTRL